MNNKYKNINIWGMLFILPTFLFIWIKLYFLLIIPCCLFLLMLIKYKNPIVFIFLLFFIPPLINLAPNNNPPSEIFNAKIKKIYEKSIFVEYDNETYYIITGETDDYLIDQVLSIETNLLKANSIDSFTLFIKSNNAQYYGYATPEIISGNPSNLRTSLYLEIQKQENEYSKFTTALLYKRKTKETNYIFDMANDLGISHLFIVSGFHISLFIGLINKATSKVIKNKRLRSLFGLTLSLTFLWFIFMPPTGVRALISSAINQQSNLNTINSLALTALIFFMYNPFLIFSSSMLLSFGITFMIHLIIMSKPKGKWFTISLISITSFTISLPIVATWNTTFNVLAPLLTIIFTPIISMLYILLIFAFPFFYFSLILDPLFWFFNNFLYLMTNIKIILIIDLISWFETSILILITFIFEFLTRKNRTIMFFVLILNMTLITI